VNPVLEHLHHASYKLQLAYDWAHSDRLSHGLLQGEIMHVQSLCALARKMLTTVPPLSTPALTVDVIGQACGFLECQAMSATNGQRPEIFYMGTAG
jgi:hypothetical protein